MTPDVEIIGVHPVESEDPCHLIEIAISRTVGIDDLIRTGIKRSILEEKYEKIFDFGDVTQEDPSVDSDNWQTAYDEQFLKETEDRIHYVFFFYFLDLSKPIMTSLGPIELPKPTPKPAHLNEIEFEPVD
jgi:hypothetical protein